MPVGQKWVDTVTGVPTVSNFNFTGGQGTPIVIDLSTNQAYYIKAGAVTALAAAASVPDPIVPADGTQNITGNLVTSGTITGSNLSGTNTGDQTITLTGDVTGSGTGSFAATIANDTVTYAKMQNVSATSRFLGRISPGAGDPEELTGTQATTLIDLFTSVLKGLAPASGGGTSNFLRADGSWAVPPGTGGITSGTTTIDFGAFPGKSDTSVTITGQAGIVAGSKVKAYIMATATADHSADEHWLETIEIMAGNIVAGTGFTIYAVNRDKNIGGAPAHNKPVEARGYGGGDTRLYGQFTVAWEWI